MSRLAVIALAFAVASPLVLPAPALARQSAGGKPAKPGGSIEKRTFKSLAELRQAFEAEREHVEKELKSKELAALKAYLAGKVADREKALVAAQELAFSLDEWADASAFGAQIASEFPESRQLLRVKLRTAGALSRLDAKLAEARKLYLEVAEKAKESENVNAHVEALDSLASLELDAGDVEASRKALERIGKELGSNPQIAQFVERRKASLEPIGTEPKPFEVKDQEGRPLSLAGLKGKVVLIDFWATWCGPCRAELPNVLETYRKYHDQGFEIVGISLDQDEDAFREFIQDEGMTWPQFFDGKGWGNEIAVLYGVQGIPQTYLLDRDGKIQRVGLRGDALERAVGALLRKKPADAKKS
jgi:thiol-disulfide isomerase/thioredoxin